MIPNNNLKRYPQFPHLEALFGTARLEEQFLAGSATRQPKTRLPRLPDAPKTSSEFIEAYGMPTNRFAKRSL